MTLANLRKMTILAAAGIAATVALAVAASPVAALKGVPADGALSPVLTIAPPPSLKSGGYQVFPAEGSKVSGDYCAEVESNANYVLDAAGEAVEEGDLDHAISLADGLGGMLDEALDDGCVIVEPA